MNNFDLYAHYYDLLYAGKDYAAEVNYINEILKRFTDRRIDSVMDLGCGTGKHASIMASGGVTVDGVDLSSEMIELAETRYGDRKGLRFFQGDITTFSTGKKYDAITSLFHVMSYQNSNEDVIGAIRNASEHLNRNGLFLFDFWYGPGVLTDPPVVRVKELSDNDIRIQRTATPVMHSDINVVDVNYTIKIYSRDDQEIEKFNETHSMRYFFKPELAHFLELCGLQVKGFYEWMTFSEPDTTSWNAVIVAKKT